MHLILQISQKHGQIVQAMEDWEEETGKESVLKIVTELYLNGEFTDSLEDVIGKYSAATGLPISTWRLSLNPDIFNIITRNHRMASEIKRLVKNSLEEKFFFAVGVSHLTYYHPTIQEVLEKEGYVITRIPPGEKVGPHENVTI